MWSLLRWGMAACLLGASVAPARAEQLTTAWRDGQFRVETANVVRRSNIVLGRPNRDATQSMPLGNGTLGVAAWAADGFTAQLSRGDTFPGRKTPGRVVIPGLAQLTSAPDFEAHLDLYDAVLTETGGGMTARIYLRSDADELVVDVSGAQQLAGLAVVTRGDDHVGARGAKRSRERDEVLHLRRVVDVDPDLHAACP